MSLRALIMAGLLGFAGSASAFSHPDVTTTKWSYTGITETTVDVTGLGLSADPAVLFGAATNSGDVLLFSPPAFTATAANGTFDETGSQLQLMIGGNSPADIIDKITIQEFGDAVFTDPFSNGTAGTGGYLSMSGFITVLEVSGVSVAPTVIGFVGTFSLGSTPNLVSNPGTSLWSGTAFIDVAAVVANATKVMVSLDNDLWAYSETGSPVGTTAKIQKKISNGVVITVPEPGAIALLALAGLGALLRTRRS
jgi:PEP-CTERM motif